MRKQRGIIGWRGFAALLTLSWLAVPVALLAAEPVTADPDLAYNVPCSGPASTPACASRTWHDCFRYSDPVRCELVGFKGMRFSEIGSESLDASKNAPYPRITGIRQIKPDRFREGMEEPGAFQVSPRMIGTHEVRIRLEICDPKIKCYAQASEFYRKVENRWIIVSWADNALGCEGWHERPDPPPECRIYIPFLKPWYD